MVLFFDARHRTVRRGTLDSLRVTARHEVGPTISFSETVAFLDVQVNHITKDVAHINNKVLSKNGSKVVFFYEIQVEKPEKNTNTHN